MSNDDTDKSEFSVSHSVDKEQESIRLEVTDHVTRMVSAEVMSLKDAALRAGLISLGWTPPEGGEE
jgi:hypothetical protein